MGKLAAASFLGDEGLDRVCQNERSGPIVDYRSPRTAVEVKAFKRGQLEGLRDAFSKKVDAGLLIAFPGLTKTWFVMPDATAAAGEYSEYRGAPSIARIEDRLGPTPPRTRKASYQ